MNEEFIINLLVLNHVNYQKFGDKKFKQSFEFWMNKLQQLKNFSTQEEACNYYIAWGEEDEKLSA